MAQVGSPYFTNTVRMLYVSSWTTNSRSPHRSMGIARAARYLHNNTRAYEHNKIYIRVTLNHASNKKTRARAVGDDARVSRCEEKKKKKLHKTQWGYPMCMKKNLYGTAVFGSTVGNSSRLQQRPRRIATR